MGRYDEAIAILKRVLDGNPNYLNSRLNLIATYVMPGKDIRSGYDFQMQLFDY